MYSMYVCTLYPALEAEMAEILVHSVGYIRDKGNAEKLKRFH